MKHLIIGSSAAGTAAASEIRRQDTSADITIISEDANPYSRCQLPWVAAAQKTPEQAAFLPKTWEEKTRANHVWNTSASQIDPIEHRVTTVDGMSFDYDRLMIATGSRSAYPPIPGLQGPNTYGFRHMQDALTLRNLPASKKRIGIIGAGLVGCELAAELNDIGKEVWLIELGNHPLPLQLDDETGDLLTNKFLTHHIHLRCADGLKEVLRTSAAESMTLLLNSGERVEVDTLVCAAGVRPNTELAEQAGIQLERGIRINNRCQTNLPDVFAAGDVTVTEDALTGRVMPSAIWPVAMRQGKIAGANMAGSDKTLTNNTGMRTSVSLFGTSFVSIGPASKPDPSWNRLRARVTDAKGRQSTRIVYTLDQQIKAAILLDAITEAGSYAEAILNNRILDAALVDQLSLRAALRGPETVTV